MKVRARRFLAVAAALGLAVAAPACGSDDDGGGNNGGTTDTGGGGGTTDTGGGGGTTDTGGGGTTDTGGGGTTDTGGGENPDTGGGGTTDTGGGGTTDTGGGGTTDTGGGGTTDTGGGTTDTGPAPACPKDEGECTVEAPATWGPAIVVSSLQIGADGKPGEALNIDPENGDQDCAPTGQCSNGLDNAASGLGSFANGPLKDSVDEGDIIIVGEAVGDMGGTFTLNLYTADPVDETCDKNTTKCDYYISDSSFNCDCEPLVAFTNAEIDGGTLTAGGNDSVFGFSFPLAEGVVLEIKAYRAQIDATVTIAGEDITVTKGILGGAIRKTDLTEAIDNYPGEDIGGLPKSTVKLFLGSLQADIDTDDDGEDDAISIGLKLTAQPATIEGLAP